MFQPGERIAERFEVEALLGEGGLAQVYRVRHTTLGTTHALKLLTMSHQSLVERLLQEGRIQAQLRHPNIVGVSDVITVRGQPGLLLEFVDCETLEVMLGRRGRLPMDEALDLFAAVLAGVYAAHKAGVLHRDIKPANILLARTPNGIVPKVSDFGIAKIAAADAGPGITRAGSAMGTPGYVAPEQMEDASNVDLRADVFSLGTILYEMVTGEKAFPSKSMRKTLNAAASGTFIPPEDLVPDLTAAVSGAIRKAMGPSPEDRYQDCESFARAVFADHPARLEVVLANHGPPTEPPAWAITGSWAKKPAEDHGSLDGPNTWPSEDGSGAPDLMSPSTDETLASRPARREWPLPTPPRYILWGLGISLGGLFLVVLLIAGLLLGRLARQNREPRQEDPPVVEVPASATSGAGEGSDEAPSEGGEATDPAAIPSLIGTWSGDPWRIALLTQEEAAVTGYIYRGPNSVRIPVSGAYEPTTRTLTLTDSGPARWTLTGQVDGRWYKGTFSQGGQGDGAPFSARRNK